LNKHKACSLENINVDRSLFNLCQSVYTHYCPVTWKHLETFANCEAMQETAVIYQHPDSKFRNLYFFRTTKQRDIFLEAPELFSDPKLFPTEKPELIPMHYAAEITSKEKNLANYCPVTLYEEDKVVKGYQLYLVFYKGKHSIYYMYRPQIYL
jgi:hypothetical protein